MINEIHLTPDSVIVMQIGVGLMPPTRAKAFSDEIVKSMKREFDCHSVIAILVPEERATTITVIHK